MWTRDLTLAVLAVSIQFGFTGPCSAQVAGSGCQGQTVAACAQKLVEIANKLVDTNKDLAKRVSSLEADVAAYKSLNDATVKALGQSTADQKSAAAASEPTVAYWEKNALTIVSGPLKLSAQTVPPEGPQGWAALHVSYGKTLKSNPVIISATGQHNDSTAGNIFDIRLDHFAIYLRQLPNGAADPANIPLYFAVYAPHD
jgi:hypothetical protein